MEQFLELGENNGTPTEPNNAQATDPEGSQQPVGEGDGQDGAQEELIAISRYKELQRVYTQSRQELAKLRAENEALAKQIKPKLELTEEEQDELDYLKTTDPDEWRARLNQLELAQAQKVRAETEREVEIARREQLLAEYNKANPDYPINNDVVQMFIPAGMLKKLENGQVTFEGFLEEASTFLKTHRIGVVGDGLSPTAGTPSPIKAVGGGAAGVTPDQQQEQDWFI